MMDQVLDNPTDRENGEDQGQTVKEDVPEHRVSSR
jgi:hypothetical protein